MPTMDIFANDAFAMQSLTTSIQDIETIPGYLGQLGLFTPNPIRTEKLSVEKRGQTLKLIKADERGAPRQRRSRDRRNIRDFSTVRLAESDELRASEIQNIRGFGSETELEAVATEVARRQAGLLDDLALTEEYHRLGAINGLLLDSDGSQIYDFFTEFGITRPAAINFNWATRTNVRQFMHENVHRPLARALGGRMPPSARIIFLCGDTFYDDFMENPEFKDTYKGFEDARQLRETNPFGMIDAYGATFVNYRGTDDNSTVAIPTNECRIFVQGVPNVFQVAYSPAESFEYVNTLGQRLYSRIVPDTKRDEFVELDVASYPLFMCTTPESLLNGTAS